MLPYITKRSCFEVTRGHRSHPILSSNSLRLSSDGVSHHCIPDHGQCLRRVEFDGLVAIALILMNVAHPRRQAISDQQLVSSELSSIAQLLLLLF